MTLSKEFFLRRIGGSTAFGICVSSPRSMALHVRVRRLVYARREKKALRFFFYFSLLCYVYDNISAQLRRC